MSCNTYSVTLENTQFSFLVMGISDKTSTARVGSSPLYVNAPPNPIGGGSIQKNVSSTPPINVMFLGTFGHVILITLSSYCPTDDNYKIDLI